MRCYNTLLSNFRSIICQVVAYGSLKTKENFKKTKKQSGRGRLQEVPTCIVI